MARCWACKQDFPDTQTYSLRITERWHPHEISLGVVICMGCKFEVLQTLLEIQDATPAEGLT